MLEASFSLTKMICKSPQSCTSHTCRLNTSQGRVRGSASSSSHGDDGETNNSDLYEFWGNLSPAARHNLLRLDKQSLFEHVRKSMYCSRCNGLLLEAFSELVDYCKGVRCDSLWHHNQQICGCMKGSCDKDGEVMSDSEDDTRDPSIHPWGGLTVTKDNALTFLDCFFKESSMDLIQNAFDCARARERERELCNPDACGVGGGGRGWMGTRSGRGHNLKETCALHTARISCDALVDFWSILGADTRRSLLRMKEEDFVARLNFRFDSKRFCRDCRRNVSRELKELKELKRCRKELRCTIWFCNADTAFSYEVSKTYVQANWREFLGGDIEGTYEHIEWGLGSTEGDSDILAFEDVGLSEGARVDGLDLEEFSCLYITLKAWKHDGKCTEVSVKAHGMKNRECLHRRLFTADGYLTITEGESIRCFFEQADEAEEEEDDDRMEKNGSEGENGGGRARRHAKSPELARDFLLDAAIIIFKEQVEKAFREKTARQNAHTMFVYLVADLLEGRIYVACKEISVLAKQKQLLEEEEHEKQLEVKKRERKKMKEKEKKMRKKEKQRGCERERVLRDEDQTKSHEVSTCSNCDSTAISMVEVNEESHSDAEMRTPSLQEKIESVCPKFVDLSLLMSNNSSESQECSDDGFILGNPKRAKRKSKIRNGTHAETSPRRIIRRGRSASFDSSPSFDLRTLKSTSISSASEIIKSMLVGTEKLDGKATFASEMGAVKLGSIKSWNDMQQKTWQNPDERQCGVKNWAREENLEKELLIVSSKEDCGVTSLQCNQWSFNPSWSEVKLKQQQKLQVETCPTEFYGSLTTALGGSSSCGEHCCGCSDDICGKDAVDGLEPNSLKTSKPLNMPTKLVGISSEGFLERDASPNARPSFPTETISDEEVTDRSNAGLSNTSDGGNASTSHVEATNLSSTSLDFNATFTTRPLTSEQPCIECVQHRKEEECRPSLSNAVDHRIAFNGFPSHYPYSGNSNILPSIVGSYKDNQMLDYGCEQDSPTGCYSAIPHSSCGYSLVPNRCVDAQLSHPQSLHYEGKSLTMGGHPNTVQTWPLFHIMPWDLTSIIFDDSNYTWWEGQNCKFEEHHDPELLSFRDGFQQYENVQSPKKNEPSDGMLGFSLFHYSTMTNESWSRVTKPLDMLSCGRYVQQEAVAMSKSNLHVEEYSLFAAAPSNRFSFF